MRIFLVMLCCVFLQGCATVGHKEFYTQTAPSKFPATESAWVFQYKNVNIDDLYKALFSDYLIIGRSSFNGPFEDGREAEDFAKSIGADILITSARFKETRTSIGSMTLPTSTRTQFSGYGTGGPYSGTATTYGTQTTTYPIQVHRYDQEGLYLKNVKNIHGWWSFTNEKFVRGTPTSFDGIWSSETYTLDLQGSEGLIYAFVIEAANDRGEWKKGQFKFFFNPETKKGLYLMGDKSPSLATFEMNKFGHLEVRTFEDDHPFSFAKK